MTEILQENIQNGDIFQYEMRNILYKSKFLMVNKDKQNNGQCILLSVEDSQNWMAFGQETWFEKNTKDVTFYFIDHIDLDTLQLK